LRGVLNSTNRIIRVSITIRSKEFNCHYFYIPAGTRNAFAVVANGTDGPGNVCAMITVVHWVCISLLAAISAKVITIDVIDITVFIVVHVWLAV